MTVIIIVIFLAILISLFSALRKMMQATSQNSVTMSKALAIRVALSFLLICVLVISYKMGIITPNPIHL